jgi:pyruvyl transferase EpsO
MGESMTQEQGGMAILKQQLEDELLSLIKPGSKVYYIDYPVYSNVGDILIGGSSIKDTD